MLGVALSGFFDGVLLHQVLQWHHLLSLVPGEEMQRLTTQVLADGLFHVLMFVIALGGGVWLWRQRQGLAAPGGSRRLLTGTLAGFGAWNVVDVVLFHWIMEIHHIRLDVAQPVLWDIGWLVLLGLAPIAAAFGIAGRGGGGRRGRSAGIALASAVALFGGGSLLSPARSEATLAVFRPGADPAHVMAAVAEVDGRLMRMVGDGSIVVIRLPEGASPWALYRNGAWLVSATAPAGCLNWSQAVAEPAKPIPA